MLILALLGAIRQGLPGLAQSWPLAPLAPPAPQANPSDPYRENYMPSDFRITGRARAEGHGAVQ